MSPVVGCGVLFVEYTNRNLGRLDSQQFVFGFACHCFGAPGSHNAGSMKDNRTIETLSSPSGRLAENLALAFQDDPALEWIVRDPEVRRRVLPRFFTIAAEQSLRHGVVLASDTRSAAALLYPPGEVKEGLWDSLRLLALFKTALPSGLRVADAMHAHHPRPQRFDYLRYLGVAPSAQGQGMGGAMVREIVGRAAAKGRGVLLETAKQDNVAIYSRLGFDIDAEWEVPGGGPRFWTMIHPAPS